MRTSLPCKYTEPAPKQITCCMHYVVCSQDCRIQCGMTGMRLREGSVGVAGIRRCDKITTWAKEPSSSFRLTGRIRLRGAIYCTQCSDEPRVQIASRPLRGLRR